MATANTKNQSKPVPKNFLEALRELGSDLKNEVKEQVSRMATQDVPQSLGFDLPASGILNPAESVSLDDLQRAELKGKKQAESEFGVRLHQMREEERARLLRQEAQTKEQIRTIQEEVRLLAKSSGELSIEIETATFQATVNPGTYHKSFFAHLKSLLIALRKQVANSRNWLMEHNSRSRKRSYYWNQVQKSGTKYMLSSERYMVTSTG